MNPSLLIDATHARRTMKVHQSDHPHITRKRLLGPRRTTMTPLREGRHPPRACWATKRANSSPSYRVKPEQTGPSVDCPRVGTHCVSRLFHGGRFPQVTRRAFPMTPVYSP